ncbi:serine/threonine protein kinase [Streptomyces verrucosisporus]|uniref:serine/threonine-protein kinase n=1 Tax=Streptomyces verrucosisporus TaxID=1695161 RepID=UPI0019D2AA6F|nr:serine/threonine-protein kinase [Streptomyces verrucosisporus]MBN3930711.1 serine/threonine protein kinase [Streptomyces verrucosisporus]
MSDVDGRGKKAGRLLGGRYRLGDVLGRGGMGTVWRAEDEVLGRTVAVKELRFPSSIDEEEKRRLITRTLREAKAIARIRSSSAVTVYDVVDEDDRPWIVMELIDGRSLADVLREDGPLEPRRAAEVGLAILDVLRAAHREGILHRDVKPSNVLIADEDGRVVLTDFGIAQVEGDPSLTSTGMLVGAPSYIAPERARGQRPGPPSDLWSLGGLLYAAVEGHPPYDKGSAIATLTAVMTEPLEPPKRAGALEAVIHGLLDKDPDKRLDEPGARALLERAARGPRAGGEEKKKEEPEGTRTTVLPVAGAGAATGSSERLRAALHGVRDVRGATAVKSAVGGGTSGGRGDSDPGELTGRPSSAGLAYLKGRRGKALSILVAVAVLVAVVASVVLVTSADGGGEETRGERGREGRSASPGGNGGRTGGDPDARETEGVSASPARTGGTDGSPQAVDGKDGGGKEEGSAEYRHEQGFSLSLPEGWKYGKTDAAGARFAGPQGQKLLVGWTTTPKSDPVKDWQDQEQWMRRARYERVSIKPVDYRGWKAADWEFTYRDSGVTYHSIDRGFVVSARLGYGIMYTAKDADWEADYSVDARRVFFSSFRPRE